MPMLSIICCDTSSVMGMEKRAPSARRLSETTLGQSQLAVYPE
jgi:hypothetical protein